MIAIADQMQLDDHQTDCGNSFLQGFLNCVAHSINTALQKPEDQGASTMQDIEWPASITVYIVQFVVS